MTDDPIDEQYDARERRLKADFEDARRTLQNAQANLDRIGNELRDLRITRRDAQKEQQ